MLLLSCCCGAMYVGLKALVEVNQGAEPKETRSTRQLIKWHEIFYESLSYISESSCNNSDWGSCEPWLNSPGLNDV